MIVKMPDGTNVSFPDDMPREQIKSLIASKFPEVVPQPAAVDKKPYGVTDAAADFNAAYEMTPLGLPARLGRMAFESGPDILKSGIQAVTAPMRAMTGDLPMTDASGRTSPQAIEEAFNMAQWVTPSSPAQGTLPKIRADYEKANPLPVTEGQEVAQAGARIGVEVPKAVASDNVNVQNVGKKLSQTPIVGTPLRNASKKATEQLDDAARRIQDDLGTGRIEVAGDRVRQDISKFATVDEPKAVSDLYKKLDHLVDPNVRIQMSATAAEAARIKRLRAKANASESKAVEQLVPALMDRSGKSYEELKLLREDFRLLKSNKNAMANLGLNERHVNDLYDALSIDLRAAAKAAGGDEGLKAFNEANSRSALFARDKEALAKILGDGSDENMATRLAALASDSSRGNVKGLLLAKSKVSKETWDELASTVVEDLARNPTNAQFTPDKFVTKWNKISESGKKLLFAPEQRQALEDIAKVSSRFKQMNEFANPSGTGGAVVLSGMLGSAGYGLVMDPTILAGSVLSAATGRTISSYLAQPAATKALADYAKAYEIAARAPGQTAQNALAKKAQALALIAANGNEQMASNLAARMATIQQTAAQEEGHVEVGQPVRKDKAWKADPVLNQAIIEGRAI